MSLQDRIIPLGDGTVLAIDKAVFKQIKAFKTMGGDREKAAKKANQIIAEVLRDGRAALEAFPTTKHGETRIKSCTKFDLTNGYRLITIQENKIILLAYLGDHGECDKWLASKAKSRIVLLETGDAKLLPVNTSIDKDYSFNGEMQDADLTHQKLHQKLKEESFDFLVSKIGSSVRRTTKKLEELDTLSPPDQIRTSVAEVEDQRIAGFICDVMSCLRAGDIESAEQRISLERGDVKLVSELSDDETLRIRDGENIKFIRIGSPEYQKIWDEKAASENFFDWFFFMHPEQARQVELNFEGPAKLSGVSGSGKTCIAVKRAIRLAYESDEKRILVITLNRSLANMIESLINATCHDKTVREKIEVISLFEFLRNILMEHDRQNSRSHSDETWKLSEHIDEVFREFYRCEVNFRGAEVLLPLHRSLVSQGIDAEQYIREEFDWIRSALSQDKRKDYLKIIRSGRKYPIIENRRSAILEGLEAWENKMKETGIIDYLGLTSKVTALLSSLKPVYAHTIIDEAQDFGTTELKILRRLTMPGKNDLYLCGDLAQHILPKKQLFAEAEIDIQDRANKIRKNYRNTREILKAAYKILYENLDEGSLESGDLAIQDPDLSNASGPKPLVLKAESLALEIHYACAMARTYAQDRRRSCIAFVGFSLLEIRRFGERLSLPVLDGTANFLETSIVLSDLEQTKGYEFDAVFILNASRENVPPLHVPKEEIYRFGSQLYVAMTRAKKDLFISYSGEHSAWFEKASELIEFDEWTQYPLSPPQNMSELSVPQKILEFEDISDENVRIGDLTGKQFNYLPQARKLSLNSLERLDDLVNGWGGLLGNKRTKWRTIEHLHSDLKGGKDFSQAKTSFGETVCKELLQRFETVLTVRTKIEVQAETDQLPDNAQKHETEVDPSLTRLTPGIKAALKLKSPIRFMPTAIELGRQIALENGIKERQEKGSHWILHDGDKDIVAQALSKVGYAYIKGKGWTVSHKVSQPMHRA